jgi:hypothetical protein
VGSFAVAPCVACSSVDAGDMQLSSESRFIQVAALSIVHFCSSCTLAVLRLAHCLPMVEYGLVGESLERGTHKPLAESSNLSLATSPIMPPIQGERATPTGVARSFCRETKGSKVLWLY